MSMFAVKANKVYQVDANSKKKYLAMGYDITDEKGNVIEHSPKATVTFAEYEKVSKQLEEAEKATDISTMTIFELLAKYAELKGIDVGQATSEEGVLKKIKEADTAE